MKITFICLILFSKVLYAQSQSGARMTAISDAGVALSDIWSLNVNQAGLLDIKKISLGTDYQKLFLNQKISSSKIVFVYPFKNQVLGAGMFSYGFDTYKQQEAVVSYTRAFGPQIAAALAIHYHLLSIESYGKTNAYSIDAGLKYRLNQVLTFGAHIANLSHHSFVKNLNFMDLPSRIQFGSVYQASDQLMIAACFEQRSNAKIEFKVGLEYQLIKFLNLRGGIRTNPIRESAGFGISLNDFQFDMAFTSHQYLGLGSQIGLSYAF